MHCFQLKCKSGRIEMRTNTLFLLLLTLSFSANAEFINRSKCVNDFKRVVRKITNLSAELSNSCWAQVEKGERNTSNIKRACGSSELDIALTMKSEKGRMRLACQTGCRKYLKPMSLCVDNKRLSYYQRKLGLRSR